METLLHVQLCRQSRSSSGRVLFVWAWLTHLILQGFLDNLDSLHYFIDHVVYKANLRGPSFRCEENPDGSLTLHYFTGRPGLYPIVRDNFDQTLRMNAAEFCAALPYHIIMDEHCRLIQTGKELANHIPKELLALGTPVMRIFEVNRSDDTGTASNAAFHHGHHLKLKGQMMLLSDGK
ncbi:heme NO binding protein, partial [Ancylostoma duodenale]